MNTPKHLGQASAAAGGAPCSGGIAPEKDWLAVGIPRLWNLVKNQQEVSLGGHHPLATGLLAEACVKQFGDFPCAW